MAKAEGGVPNVLAICVLVLLICIATGNPENGVSSMIIMVLFNYLKFNFSATKRNPEKLLAGGGVNGKIRNSPELVRLHFHLRPINQGKGG